MSSFVAVRAASLLGRGTLGIRVVEPPVQHGYVVYSDAGIPDGSDVWTWDGSAWGLQPGDFDGDYTGESPPEGTRCFETSCGFGYGNYAGWGVFLCKPSDHTIDLSMYNELKFWVKVPLVTSTNLFVQVQQGNRSGPKSNRVYVYNYGWTLPNTWQEITIPKSAFEGIDFSRVFCPFMITVDTGSTGWGPIFYVDYVRWV